MPDMIIKVDLKTCYAARRKKMIICPHCKKWNNKKPLVDINGECPECKRQFNINIDKK